MTRRRISGAGPLAASLAGVLGFGTLYRGVAGHRLDLILPGLALALFGLDRAGRALAASVMLAESRRAACASPPASGGGGGRANPGPGAAGASPNPAPAPAPPGPTSTSPEPAAAARRTRRGR
jgi:hypothetical protein